MKIVQINSIYGGGSTGRICASLSNAANDTSIENYILYTQGKSDDLNVIRFACEPYKKLQALKSRVLGNYGFNSRFATKKLIRILKRISPDVVHLHNIHGHDCDLRLLFEYFKEAKINLIWTFHDCWAFTGYCTHFDMIGCNAWQSGCEKCPQYKKYSWFFDKSKFLYERKNELFSNLDLTIVTPSKWLADLVGQSFLKEYPIKIINNGIDFSNFKPTASVFREKHGIGEKRIALGVAFGWGYAKGLDVFIELSKRLDNSKYQIVLVGTNAEIDKELPDNIISIHRTSNQQELAEIYSAADVFVNPTREENFPTVNIEALACGTPIITFRTGGSPEILDETCGSVVECDDIDAMEREIIRICEEAPFFSDACITRAARFNKDKMLEEYFNLYKEVLNDRASKKGI